MASQPSVGGADPHVVDRLVEYLSGSLAPADDAAVESHLMACAACRDEFTELGPIALMMALQPDGSVDGLPADDYRKDGPLRR